jgi:hypothetical protein
MHGAGVPPAMGRMACAKPGGLRRTGEAIQKGHVRVMGRTGEPIWLILEANPEVMMRCGTCSGSLLESS